MDDEKEKALFACLGQIVTEGMKHNSSLQNSDGKELSAYIAVVGEALLDVHFRYYDKRNDRKEQKKN